MGPWSRADEGENGRRRVLPDGGTEDDDAVAEIKEMLESDDGDDGLADAVGGTAEEAEDEESSPAMDFGLKLGAPLALVAVGLLFVGPAPLLKFTPGDVVFVGSTNVDGPGNIWYISGLTFAVSLVTGLLYPSFTDDPLEDFKTDLGLGISFPTIGVLVVLGLLLLFWPVLYSLLAGKLITAGVFLVVAVVAVGIAVAGSIVTLALIAIATLYFVGPALVGSYVGGFVGELIST